MYVSCNTNVPQPVSTLTAFIASGGVADDNCNLNEDSFEFVGDVSDNQTNPETITRTYRVEDECGNFQTCNQLIIVDPVEIQATVILEGAAIAESGAQTFTSTMRTKLNSLRVLPGQAYQSFFSGTVCSPVGQPYNIAPWNYSGTEGAAFTSNCNPTPGDAGYATSVVDWVLVSLRVTPSGNPICMAAALLHANGTIEFVGNGFTCCDINYNSTYYVVIEHRNHLIVMSHIPVPVVGGKITYNFKNQQSYRTAPIFAGQKEILPGVFAMYAGNGQQVTGTSIRDINFDDRTYWELQNGTTGSYKIGDYNLNADCKFNDRVTWEFNLGKFTSVPR